MNKRTEKLSMGLRPSMPGGLWLPLCLRSFSIAFALCVVSPGLKAQELTIVQPPLQQKSARFVSGHVQGIAVDEANGFIYYSFTNLLAKYDFAGTLIGTLEGWTGHLGDLDFNVANGKVYGSLEYKADQAFYIAVIDVARIDEIGLQATHTDILKTVYLPEVVADYSADLDADGLFDGDVGATLDHRYGCSGIDGVSFGPAFGRTDGEQLLTVAYGIYNNVDRLDNDHQVLLQYDIGDWEAYARPLVEAAPHQSGPDRVSGKYFVRTGNTTYGVQTLAYAPLQQRWFMGVYQGKKPEYPNYLLFAVDAATPVIDGELLGVPSRTGTWEQGKLLTLSATGVIDPTTGVRGWHQKADVGFQPLKDGRIYIAQNQSGEGWQSAELHLVHWLGDADSPLAPVQPVPE